MTLSIMAMEGPGMSRELQGPKSPCQCPRLRRHKKDTGPVTGTRMRLHWDFCPMRSGDGSRRPDFGLAGSLRNRKGSLMASLLAPKQPILQGGAAGPAQETVTGWSVAPHPPEPAPILPCHLPLELLSLLSCLDPSREASKASWSSW